MCMERSRFQQTMASEWQTAFVISHKMPRCAVLTAVKNYNKSLEKLQDFFLKTETKTKTKCSRPRPIPRLHDPRPGPKVYFFCPRDASRPTPLSRGLHHWNRENINILKSFRVLQDHYDDEHDKIVFHKTIPNLPDQDQDQDKTTAYKTKTKTDFLALRRNLPLSSLVTAASSTFSRSLCSMQATVRYAEQQTMCANRWEWSLCIQCE